ncbi:MAG: hypothetical protein AABZ06_12790 [Bdellovibrionota bacterium]
MNTGNSIDIPPLISALPTEFEFYHLGNVKLSPGEPVEFANLESLVDDYFAIAFSFLGDLRSVLVILFDRDLDVSTYTEMGNVLASQIAVHLNKEEGLDVMISPPHVLNPTQLRKLLAYGAPIIRKKYLHSHGNRIVTVQTLLIPTQVTTIAGDKTNA